LIQKKNLEENPLFGRDFTINQNFTLDDLFRGDEKNDTFDPYCYFLWWMGYKKFAQLFRE
jgi:hypothetical protein